jgi:hypothetical protein
MNSKLFEQNVKEYLGKVKTKLILGVEKNREKSLKILGTFNKKQKYPHILADELCVGVDNSSHSKYVYFDIYRNEIINMIKSENIKLHRFQKNLNSSQSMALNYFLPIIIENKEKDFGKFIFGLNNIEKIELEVSMEDSGGRSSQTEVDCIFEEKNGIKHLFEIKYTENGFGKAKNGKKYMAKWEGIKCENNTLNLGDKKVKYSQIMDLFNKNTIDYNFFLKNYQLVRNLYNTFFELKNGEIIKKDKIGTMSCIFSKRNLTQYKEFIEFKKNLKIEYYDKINIFYWEDIVNKSIRLSKEYKSLKLKKYFEKFNKFYLEF